MIGLGSDKKVTLRERSAHDSRARNKEKKTSKKGWCTRNSGVLYVPGWWIRPFFGPVVVNDCVADNIF